MANNTDGPALRAYLLLSNYTQPLFNYSINRRLKHGKEDPERYREKFANTNLNRPAGTLLWMHGVGLGEVLALRGLIEALKDCRPALSFLVTSSTKASAAVFTNNCPANTQHQLLPVDCVPAITDFLDHWQPDLSIWAEQDLWPAMVCHTSARQIPMVILNARMNEQSYRKRKILPGLYRDLYKRFRWISTQDSDTAKHMTMLGAKATVGGSLKTAAVPLQDYPQQREAFAHTIQGRRCWLLASSHREDEQLALASHTQLLKTDTNALLIIAPRNISRSSEIEALCKSYNLHTAIRSQKQQAQDHQVYIADSFGEMGIWYRLCDAAFIGGSMNKVQGHNPWEAAALGCAIIHGPQTANFKSDYQQFKQHQAAIAVSTSTQLSQALHNTAQLNESAHNARSLATSNNHTVDRLAQRVLTLLDTPTAV